MCNLSQGIKEDGIENGKEIGEELGIEKVIVNMHRRGFTLEQIADATEKERQAIEAVIRQSEGFSVN